jgi:sugar phosphate isomerase/epimerase
MKQESKFSHDTHSITRRGFIQSGMCCGAMALVGCNATGGQRGNWPIGHHNYNWDHAWDNAEHLDLRLRLTRDTGYEGIEAKPNEFGVPAEVLKDKCAEYSLQCAAVGGNVKEAIDYAHIVGAHVVRAQVTKEEGPRWVDYAGERDIMIVVHNHIGRRGQEGPPNIETREDLLRYLDERPGVYACPDTAHLELCGSDSVQTIRDLGERCGYVHLKDIVPDKVGVHKNIPNKFIGLGKGAIDIPGVLTALEEIGYNNWIMVERDNRVEDYEQSAREMREYLRELGC